MVQTDVSQLSAECQEWRQILRNYREEFQLAKKSLEEICKKTLSKKHMLDLDHFDNQFHIQLINIHDLKHVIKNHESVIRGDRADTFTEAVYEDHERLLERFLRLENTFQELRIDFRNFINEGSC
jgi:D-ribose pyranose/furanose isomerase RbsD